MKTILNPSAFKGNLKRKKYFEGWYLKHISQDHSSVYSFIPGISLSPGDRHAFIQVINGITAETWYVPYSLESFEADRKGFNVRVGESSFSPGGCTISIDTDDLKISGSLVYKNASLYPRTLTHPGMMGWFSFVPGMECRHDVLSMNHYLAGQLTVKGEVLDFDGGKGYIEKDWGWNFPLKYTWIQCNHFDEADTSFMTAVAAIPIGPIKFTGFLGFFLWKGKVRVFGTWNSWKVKDISYSDELTGRIEFTSRTESIICRVEGRVGGSLKAPEKGSMNKVIKESIDSIISLEYRDSHGKIHHFNGNPAAFERRD